MLELVYKFDEKSYREGESIAKVRFNLFLSSNTYMDPNTDHFTLPALHCTCGVISIQNKMCMIN